MHSHLTLLHAVVSAVALATVAGRMWLAIRRYRSWKRLLAWGVGGILFYAAFIYLIAGPAAPIVDRMSAGAMLAIIAIVGVPAILVLLEGCFAALDGPFPQLPSGAAPVNICRQPLYKWMGIAAAVVLAMAGMTTVAPDSWQDTLFPATFLVAIFSCFWLWFLHYMARRFDYGRSALLLNPWLHWSYTQGELEYWSGIAPGPDSDAWLGANGLLFAGEYAPWDLMTYRLVRAGVRTEPSPRLDFTFEKTSFGNAISVEKFHVPVPVGHSSDLEEIDRKLRDLCPRAEIDILDTRR